jgi:ABC-2 type transport system permease protein
MTPTRRSISLVAWREITERTQSRAFLLSTIAIIAMVVAGVVVPALNDQKTRLHTGITGATPAGLTAALRDAARAGDARLELRRYPSVAAGENAVRDGQADVLIVAGERLVWKSERDAELAAW